MGSYKAPGPNGYHAVFFKMAWNMLGGDVHSFVKGVLEGKEIPSYGDTSTFCIDPEGDEA